LFVSSILNYKLKLFSALSATVLAPKLIKSC